MPRRLRAEEVVTIRVLTEQGANHCQIARTLGVTEGTVGHHLRRAAVGPARFIKSAHPKEVADLTAQYSPGVYTGRPDDFSTVKRELLLKEHHGFPASHAENPDESKALTAAGECAQRVKDMPKVEELILRITRAAKETLESTPAQVLS